MTNLQVRFHEKFHGRGLYDCQKDLSEIFYNGYEIYMEFGGILDGWIDVMVSSPESSAAESAEWVEENILSAIYQLCSEPTGLPGVDLVMKIMRPCCLTASPIVPRRYRRDDQCVTEEMLIEGMEREEYNYKHSWPAIGDEQGQEILPRSCDDAMALIRPKTLECHFSVQRHELHRVCESFNVVDGNSGQRHRESGCENSAGSGGDRSEAPLDCDQPTNNVQKVGDLLTSSIHNLARKSDQISTGSFGDCSEAPFGCEQPPKYAQELADLMTRGFHDVCRKVDRNFRSINEMKEVANIQREEQRNAFARICSTLSSISVFATEQHSHRLPHRVLITERTPGSCQKLSFLIGLRAVELHLMCESRGCCHVVHGQKGKKLRLPKEESRHAWTLFKWTILAVTALLKTGCTISMGIHQLVPDLGGIVNWTSFVIGAVGDACLDFVDLEDLKRRMNNVGKDMFKDDGPEDGMQRQKAMEWLERILEGGAVDEVWERFDLRRVKYRDTGSVAWICSSCLKNSQLFVEPF
ncbi:hypothetical protein CBR_g38576 [Chara braunii]|uniref:Uncharacterized protein n=1 Tax=Chara braunii TaxID=69332 RepID=A0A388K0D9_CHABU|nr:hypothetical protein CBR_g38576 [Chara braunii]|eukprot:GBG63508.1 hypothetical protein CBR_g38576 [Chara braunii]